MDAAALALSLDPLKLEVLRAGLRRQIAQQRLAVYRPYVKQADFHAMGAVKRERMLSAGNHLGKTLSASAEVAMHVTGRYPDWWVGKRFTKGNHGLAGSESGELTRKGVQRLLFGRDPKMEPGTGMIPGDCILGFTWSRHVNDLIDTARIRFIDEHGNESVSTISLKAYEQGRGKWQADTVDWVWFDEEPPEEIYTEGLTRTNATFGPVIVTCTLLSGMTAIATRFWLELHKYPDAGMVNMTIDDVEHYTSEQKAGIIASYPAHEREARTKGVPMLGSGRIFAVEEESIIVRPFRYPDYWRCIGGMDFGWDHPSAAVKLVHDADEDVVYLTNSYRQSKAVPIVFAAAVKPWGEWLPWSWPADGLQTEKGSGKSLAPQYRDAGMNLLEKPATHPPADGEEEGTGGNSVEAGITRLLERMMTGRFKVFEGQGEWLEEFRMYHRKDGKVVKLKDDLMAATRYAEMMLRHAITKPAPVVRGGVRVNHSVRRGGY